MTAFKFDKRELIFRITGILLGVLFVILMGIRLGDRSFQHPEPMSGILPVEGNQGLPAVESWMNIHMNGARIGYSHRKMKRDETGHDFYDRSFLRMNIMGKIGDVFMETKGRLNPDYSLGSFSFELASDQGRFFAGGQVRKNKLLWKTAGQKMEIPITGPLYLYASIFNALPAAKFQKGQSIQFQVFDPVSANLQVATVCFEGDDPVRITDSPVPARKFRLEYKGISQHAWLDRSGNVIRETGPMGMQLVKTTKTDALDRPGNEKMADLTATVSIASNVILSRPESIKELRFRISGLYESFHVDGGRQKYSGDTLFITKENPDTLSQVNDPEAAEFLKPSSLVQSDHPEIRRIVSSLVSPSASGRETAARLVDWIYRNIEKTPMLSVPDALNTLKSRKGDCNEHAALLAAMAMAAGIPAQIESGLVYLDGRFYYHAWNVLHLDGWITADAALGQFPADVTHIRLIRGDTARQFDLVHAIGNIHLEIIDD